METETTDELAAIADEIEARITSTIWCTLATTDAAGRPRTRIVRRDPGAGSHVRSDELLRARDRRRLERASRLRL